MKTKLISKIAGKLMAIENCKKSGNKVWEENHTKDLKAMNDLLPSGSGIDSGCKILIEESKPNKVRISFSYHHMNEDGYYDGWTDHVLTITPTLFCGFDMKISGRDRNGAKDYFYEIFSDYLNKIID